MEEKSSLHVFFCVLQALYSHGLKCLSFCQKLNWMIKEKLKFSVCCDLYKFLWPKSAPGHAVHRVCDLHKSLEVVRYVFPMHVQNSILMQMKSNSWKKHPLKNTLTRSNQTITVNAIHNWIVPIQWRNMQKTNQQWIIQLNILISTPVTKRCSGHKKCCVNIPSGHSWNTNALFFQMGVATITSPPLPIEVPPFTKAVTKSSNAAMYST